MLSIGSVLLKGHRPSDSTDPTTLSVPEKVYGKITNFVLTRPDQIDSSSGLWNTLPVGLFPETATFRGRVAQLGEHRPYKPGVTGSSPVPPTIFDIQ